MITMYGFGKVTSQVIGITRDLRVLWALEECELPHQVHGLNDFAGELHSAECDFLLYALPRSASVAKMF